MQIFKKILTTNLLAILLFSQVGYYFFYIKNQYQIKQTIKHQLMANLPDSLLHIVDGNNKSIVWEEVGKEFSMAGEMYDVVKIKIIDGKQYLFCLNDVQETNLLSNFAKSINDSNNSKKDQSKNTLKFQLIACHNIEKWEDIYYQKSIANKFFNFQQKSIEVSALVLSPPPKI